MGAPFLCGLKLVGRGAMLGASGPLWEVVHWLT